MEEDSRNTVTWERDGCIEGGGRKAAIREDEEKKNIRPENL